MAIRGSNATTIASSIEDALDSGTMGTGQRLPAIRELAKTLRVSPVTVAAAYRLLRTRGLAAGDGRRGTTLRVQTHLAAMPAEVRHPDKRRGLIDLATGNPDPALLPSIGPAVQGLDPNTRLYDGSLDVPALVAFAAGEFAADGVAAGPVAVTS